MRPFVGLGAAVAIALGACAQDFDMFHLVASDAAADGVALLPDGGPGADGSGPGVDGESPDAGSNDGGGQETSTEGGPPPCNEPQSKLVDGHCYFPLAAPTSWDVANGACVDAGAHLASITSAAEQTAVTSFVNSQERWLGLRRPNGSPSQDSSFAWSSNEPRGGYSNWESGEPNGSGECVRMRTSTAKWSDLSCTQQRSGLCERE
jgi:hypothetical protein